MPPTVGAAVPDADDVDDFSAVETKPNLPKATVKKATKPLATKTNMKVRSDFPETWLWTEGYLK